MKLNRLEPLPNVQVRDAEYSEVEVNDDTMKGYTFGKGKKKSNKKSAKGKKSGKAPPWK
jgi:hypothetical protein